MNTTIKFLNSWGGSFENWASSSLLQTAILLLALALVDLLARKRSRATVRYVIWMLMLLKLALPVDFSLPTGLVRLETRTVVELMERPRTIAEPMMFDNLTAGEVAASTVAAVDRNDSKKVLATTTMETLTWRGALFGIWAIGFWAGGFVVVARSFALRRLVKRAETASEELKDALRASARSVGVAGKISVRITEEIQAPALAGLFRPVILLPPSVVAGLSAQELRAVLVHELSHVRRRDVLVNCAQAVLQIVHFFNPFVWLANARIRQLREEAVDEMALVSLGDANDVYPETLVHVARLAISPAKFFPGAIGIMEKESGISTRVKWILARPAPKTVRIGARGAVAILCLGAILLPMARGQRGKETETIGKTKPAEIGATTARVNPLKDLTLEQVFAKYEYFKEMNSRAQSALVSEITQREGGYDFILAQLKKHPNKPDTQPVIDARRKAAHLTTFFGERARSAIPLLIAALEDDDLVRSAATQAIGELGPVAKEAIPTLIEELQFQNQQAPHALMRIAPQSEEVINALIEAMLDKRKDENLRHQSIIVFSFSKPKSEKLDAALEKISQGNDSEFMKRAARSVMGKPGPPHSGAEPFAMPGAHQQSDIPMLLQKLKENPNDYQTARALAFLGPEAAAQAIPLLMDIIENKKARYSGNFVGVLGDYGTNAAPAIPMLVKYAQGDDLGLVGNSLNTLGRIGPQAISTKPLVISFLDDPSPRLRFKAAVSLWQIDSNEVHRILPIVLSDTAKLRPGEEDYTMMILGKIGPAAKPAVPRLLETLKSDSRSRIAAALALVQIQPDLSPQVIPEIIRELKSQDHYRRIYATSALGEIGPAAKKALPDLKEMLKDPHVAKEATEAIKKIEATPTGKPQSNLKKPGGAVQPPPANPLQDVSIEQLFDRYDANKHATQRDHAALGAEILRREKSYDFLCAKLKKTPGKSPALIEARRKAAHLLGRFGERAQPAAPILIAALEDEDSVRFAATSSLGMIGPAAREAIPPLIDELNFQNSVAVSALMRIAPNSEEVSKALIDALLDKKKDEDVRQQILMVFQQAKPKSQRLDDGLKAIVEGKESEQLKRIARLILGISDVSTAQSQPKYTISDLPKLLKQLKDSPNSYGIEAIIASLGPEAAAEAIPVFMDLIEQKKGMMGRPFQFLRALGSFGTNALPALPLLMKHAQGEQIAEAQVSIMSIGQIGSVAIAAKPVLVSLLDDPNPSLRFPATSALLKIQPDLAPEMLPRILPGLTNTDLNYRLYALGALYQMGPAARPALPNLRLMINAENPQEAKNVAAAIKQIEENP